MRSLVWAVIQYEWCLTKMENFDTETYMQKGDNVKRHRGNTIRRYTIVVIHLQANECQRLLANL